MEYTCAERTILSSLALNYISTNLQNDTSQTATDTSQCTALFLL